MASKKSTHKFLDLLVRIILILHSVKAFYDYHPEGYKSGYISRHSSKELAGIHQETFFNRTEDSAVSKAIRDFSKSDRRYSLTDSFKSFEHSAENRFRNKEKYGVSGNCSNSRDIGTNFKFSSLSRDESLLDFKKSLGHSVLFTFTNLKDGMYSVIMLSLDKDFHPQLRLYKVHVNKPDMYQKVKGENAEYGSYSSKYFLEKGEYVLEIGIDETIDMFPFKDSKYGRFLCLMSQEKKSLQEIITSHKYKVTFEEDIFYVPKNHKEALFEGSRRNSLENWNDNDLNIKMRNEAKNSNKNWGYGNFDYQVTPYFNEATGTCEIYARAAINSQDNYEATTVKLKCKENANINQIFYGQLIFKNFYEFRVESKSSCDLIDIISK